jgi:hypothetical protein
VLRHTFAVGSPDEVISMARLGQNTGLSLRHTRLAVNGLVTRGLVEVQHRQNTDRGKLPSRFGVRVLGEPAPFSTTGQGPVTRPTKSEDPVDQARPVWLLPSIEDEATGTPSIARTPEATDTPAPIRPVFSVSPPSPAQTGGTPDPASAAPRSAGANTNAPARGKDLPTEWLRDGHPVWAAVKRILAERLPRPIFMERIAPTSSVGGGGPELLVAVQSEYHRWWLESKLGRQVREALIEAGYPDQRIRYLNYNGPVPAQSLE